MKRKRNVGPLPLRATYTSAALAEAIGIGRMRMDHLLRAEKVVTYRAGRSLLVPRSEIEEKLPAL